jgi:hypothetical protein
MRVLNLRAGRAIGDQRAAGRAVLGMTEKILADEAGIRKIGKIEQVDHGREG